ncbi:MAG: hypothetical protein GXC72_05705 [Chitinophagaceae bacterium]|nr:hypothetical protein [Chitinophagaceae bacterium]
MQYQAISIRLLVKATDFNLFRSSYHHPGFNKRGRFPNIPLLQRSISAGLSWYIGTSHKPVR